MKLTSAAFLVLGLFVCGCSQLVVRADRAVAEFLGPAAVHVLSRPTRVEGWNFQRPDGSITADPQLKPLTPALGRELATLLLDDDTYRTPAGPGSFQRAVGFRLWRDEQIVDVFLSLANDQMVIKYTSYSGQPTNTLSGIGAAHDKFVRIAREAFPEYKPPTR